MPTTIISNGWPGISGDRSAPLDVLLRRLTDETLDPMFEQYGNFVFQSDTKPGLTCIWGNFASYSHVFSIDTDDPQLIERLTAAIRANQATERYALAKIQQEERAGYWRRRQADEDAARLEHERARARSVLGIGG